MDHSLMVLAPRTVASVYQTTTVSHLTSSAASGDILSNSKALALLLPGLGGVVLIAVGWIWTVRKIKEGIGEAIIFQVGLIVVGVLIVLSVGIAAAATHWAVDQGIVDRQYFRGDEWGS